MGPVLRNPISDKTYFVKFVLKKKIIMRFRIPPFQSSPRISNFETLIESFHFSGFFIEDLRKDEQIVFNEPYLSFGITGICSYFRNIVIPVS